MNFNGKVVVVTGGSSGIGKAAAVESVKQGANVVLNGRREKALRQTIQEIDPASRHHTLRIFHFPGRSGMA